MIEIELQTDPANRQTILALVAEHAVWLEARFTPVRDYYRIRFETEENHKAFKTGFGEF